MRTDNEGREMRSVAQLRRILHAQIDEICDDLEWKRRMTHGQTRAGDGTGSRASGPSDNTGQIAIARDGLRDKVRRGTKDLVWLVDTKLPQIQGRLELDDDRPRASDEADDRPGGPAYITGGLSAYRGDRHAPKSRPDLAEALEAQRRRRRRGEEYGDA